MRCLFCLESCRWHKNQSQSYPLTSTCAMTHVLAHTLITFYRNWFASSIDNELVTNIAYYVTGMNELSVSGWGGGLWMSGLWWDFFSCLFWDRVPLCSLDWSQTQRSLCLHLLGAGIKGMGHHTSPLSWQHLACYLRLVKSCSLHVHSRQYLPVLHNLEFAFCQLEFM